MRSFLGPLFRTLNNYFSQAMDRARKAKISLRNVDVFINIMPFVHVWVFSLRVYSHFLPLRAQKSRNTSYVVQHNHFAVAGMRDSPKCN